MPSTRLFGLRGPLHDLTISRCYYCRRPNNQHTHEWEAVSRPQTTVYIRENARAKTDKQESHAIVSISMEKTVACFLFQAQLCLCLFKSVLLRLTVHPGSSAQKCSLLARRKYNNLYFRVSEQCTGTYTHAQVFNSVLIARLCAMANVSICTVHNSITMCK